MDRIQTGEKDRIIVYALNSSSAGVSGATITLSLRRDTDGYWWNGTTFQSAYTTVTMTETDSTNWPGMYHYDFTPPSVDANISMRATTGTAAVVNDPWVGQVKAGAWVDNIDAAITSRGSATDVTEILKRFGGSILDIEFRRVVSLIDQVKNLIGGRLLR